MKGITTNKLLLVLVIHVLEWNCVMGKGDECPLLFGVFGVVLILWLLLLLLILLLLLLQEQKNIIIITITINLIMVITDIITTIFIFLFKILWLRPNEVRG